MIHIENLVKRYGDLVALDHLSLNIQEGEIFGLLGPNGSGKTTAINCLLALLKYDKGTITIFGKPMRPNSYDIKKDIGVVMQNVAVFEQMTVRENIDYFCGLYVKDKEKRRSLVEEAIAFTGLEDFEKMRPKKLSGGLLRRLNIACGIVHKPKLIILDEPTVGLDPKQIIEIRDMIKGLGKQHTVILSSHILSEVSAVCDHIMIIAHGKLIASDTPENLEQRLKGAAGLDLTVKGSAEALRPVLEEIHGLSIERMEAGSEDGTCVANLQFVGGGDTIDSDSAEFPDLEADIRETIFYALANHRLPILSMAPSKASLEEIFLELTEDYPKTREDSGAADPTDQSKEEEPQ